MSANSKIEWTDHTFNPWVGCTKVSPGCDHCYAESWAKRSGMVKWGTGASRRRTTPANWAQVAKWDAAAGTLGTRVKVFCASLADVFDNEVDPAWRLDLSTLIASTENIDWLILTKRIGNVMSMCSSDSMLFDVIGEKVWLGISVVNQDEADRDVPKLLRVPAHKHFLSCEPLLGLIDLCGKDGQGSALDPYEDDEKLDWVIAGGESGPGARPMHPDWARSLRDQCRAAGVPFLFKQWGEWAPGDHFTKFPRNDAAIHEWLDGDTVIGHSWRVGKKTAGRTLDGITHDEFPK